jgi:hypothetical protein
MRDKTEAKIQQEIFIWYHNSFCLAVHVPRCSIFAVPNDSSSKEETMRKLATGMIAGVSDLIVLQPNKILFVEVKSDTGRQSDKQKDFENIVKSLGFEYHLVRSLDDFKKIINGKEN